MIKLSELADKSDEERISMASEYYERGDYVDCERVVSYILDSDAHNPGALGILGAMLVCQDRYGMAEMVYRYGTALYPHIKSMWVGLGTSIRNPERHAETIMILEDVLQDVPDNTAAMTNLASMYVEIGEYKKGLELAEKALLIKEDDRNSTSSTDIVALASLGLEDFEKGFRLNRNSLGVKFRKEIVYGDEERWECEKDKVVIIYGEQGLGDEIFYGSCVNDAIKDCKKVIIDCDVRLESLFKRSFPDAFVYGTRRKAAPWLHSHKWDYRCAMADLPAFYRKSKEDFNGEPFLKADPTREAMWASLFGSRTKIGIAFRGGSKFTNRRLRTVPLESFEPLREHGDLVSLEYSDFDYGDFEIENYDWATQSEDYDNVAALISQLDYVVTTCTSVVHLAGALGVPCFVLRNKYYGWRYANDMPWYNSVRVIHCDGDWDKGIEEVVKLIKLRKVA